MDLDVTAQCVGGPGSVCVVRVGGEVDLSTAPRLREALLRALQDGNGKVVADLSAVSFLDSSGIGVLVSTRRRAELMDGWLRLACPSARVAEVLSLTGLDRVFDIRPEGEAALDDA